MASGRPGSSGPGSESRATHSLSFGLLGPLVVEVAGRPVALTGTRTKALLAILLAHANSVVSADRLIDDLWAGKPTPGATATLQGYVSELRRALTDALGEPAPVLTRRPGYLVRVEPDQLDVLRFERLVARAKSVGAGEPGERAALLREALGLWRGPALSDFADEAFARPIAVHLEESRMWALEERVETELHAGGHAELVTELSALAEQNPLRERLWGQYMLALYRCGRQADALRAYQVLRRRLADELGIEPSPAVQRLEHAILAQDASLEQPSEAAAGAPSPAPSPLHVPVGAAAGGAASAGARAAAVRNVLPVKLTRFVGRRRELEETGELLAGTRLLTLAGSSGSGKTRLAVELVAGQAERWPDGVHFVDLSALDRPELLPAVVATSMGLSERGASVESIVAHIGDATRLLLFDNCEHLVDACADLVEAILSTCPGTTVLATSQEELRIGPERVWRVPPLSLPAGGDGAQPEQLMASEAVQLFLDRASPALRDFADDPATLAAAARICQRLDGIPLAIELAASLVNVLPLEEIARRLDDRFALLTTGSRRAVSRHRTLRAAIDWSYELLAPSERELFDGLSVFVGQFGVEAAEATAGSADFLADLAALVSKSMVVTVPGPGGSRRYQLLDSLRLYGLERLQEAGREAEARRRHAAYFMSFVMAADRQLHGPDPLDWSARIVKDMPNIRAAMEWSFSEGDLEVGVQLAAGLRSGYVARMGQLDRTKEWLAGALEPGQGLSPALRLKALSAAMVVGISLGDNAWSSTFGEEAVALAEAVGDRHDLAFVLAARGSAAIFEGKVGLAVECFERALGLCREIGDEWTRGSVLTYWGVASRRTGHDALARSQLEEALAVFRVIHDDYAQVVPLIQLALLAKHMDDLEAAGRWADEALDLARRLGDRQLSHGALCIAGHVELAQGHPDEARRLLRSSLATGVGLEHSLFLALAVEGLAVLAHQEGRDADAARLWGFSDGLRAEQSMPMGWERLAERDRLLEGARARVGDEAVDHAMESGRRLTYAQVREILRTGGDAA